MKRASMRSGSTLQSLLEAFPHERRTLLHVLMSVTCMPHACLSQTEIPFDETGVHFLSEDISGD